MGMIMHDDVPYGEGTSYTQGTGIAINNNVIAVDADNTPTENSEKPVKSKGVYEEIEQIYADNGVLGAKNLLKYPYITTTITRNGITFTDNGDGSVTVNGTATASADFHCGAYSTPYYYDFVNRYKGTDRKFRFAGKTSNVRLQFWSTNFTVYDENAFAFPANINMGNFNFSIHVDNGVTVNNETIYPMMILASDPDDTYVPYAMTNRELTEELTVQESAVTDIISGATVGDLGNHLYKVGKVVTLTLRLNGVTATAWTRLFKIPSGYTPKSTLRILNITNVALQPIQIGDTGDVLTATDLANTTVLLHSTWITD